MGSLDGIRVLDLSRVLGAPLCTQILADHGAEVIKVESPQGDETRSWGPPFREDGLSAYFIGANRGKSCVTIDLTHVEGQKLLAQLLEKTDVLVENFKPGTLGKWGFSDEDLQKKFPRLIHCQLTGFSDHGPLGGLAGYDAALQAWTGMMSLNGTQESGPLRMALPLVDLSSGLYAAIGVMLALFEREKSGKGQRVATSLYETGLALLHPHAANYFLNKKIPQPQGSAHPNISPYDSFQTGDGLIFLAVGNNAQFAKLCEHLGRAELACDLRFQNNKDRVVNRTQLKAELEIAMQKYHSQSLAMDLLQKGVPCGPVHNLAEALQHEQAKALEMVVQVQGCDVLGVPVKLSRTPAKLTKPPERQGESTEKVLRDLGLSASEIAELKKSKTVFT